MTRPRSPPRSPDYSRLSVDVAMLLRLANSGLAHAVCQAKCAESADKGGHLAAWEQPKLLVDEMRAGFESLR
jgi:hypothetical protein